MSKPRQESEQGGSLRSKESAEGRGGEREREKEREKEKHGDPSSDGAKVFNDFSVSIYRL